MHWRTILKFAIPIAILIILLAYGLWPRPVLVDAATAQHGPLTVTVDEEGKTRVIDRYVISAPVPGVACRLDLNVGDRVARDEILLRLEPLQSEVLDPRSRAEAQARVAAARSALHGAEENAEAAEADAEYAKAELQRLQRLAESGAVSQDMLDKARTAARRAEAAQRSARFAVDVARYELTAAQTALKYSAADETVASEKVPIRSPVDGEVLKKHHECEGVVASGQPLLEVGDTSRLEVEVDVLSKDAVRIQPGMRVLFHRWGGEDPLEGRVRTVEPVGFTKISALGVEEQRVFIIADFVSPYAQWARLGDGYRVEASFILWEGDNVLQIPTSALFRYDEGWAVFVIEDGTAKRRVVKIGQRTGLKAQILEGLSPGDQVIIHPDDRIAQDVDVAIRQRR